MIKNLRIIQSIGIGTAGYVVKVGKEEIYAQKIMNVDEDFDIERFKKFMNEHVKTSKYRQSVWHLLWK